MMSNSQILGQIKYAFAQSLCDADFSVESDGYLSACVINTYIFSIPVWLLACWAVATSQFGTDGRPQKSKGGHVKMILTGIYVILATKFGPTVFNPISQTVSMLTLLMMFVLSFMDLNGSAVATKPIELYYFATAGSLGYLFLKLVVNHVSPHEQEFQSVALLCVAAFVNATARNIVDAIEPPPPKK